MQVILQISLFFLLSVIFLDFQKNGPFAYAAVEEKPCAAVMGDLTKKQLSGISGCTKSLKLKNGKEKAKKQTCIMKCVLKKEGFVTADGQIQASLFEKWVENNIPPSMHQKVNASFGPCIVEKPYDDQEEFCKDYDPIIKCLLGVLPNLCK